MVKRMLVNNPKDKKDGLRVGITQDGILVDLDIEHPGQEQKKSNIYKGRITSIEPSLGAVFVDYGSERHGFLPLKEISPEYFLTPTEGQTFEQLDIKKILREGQEIVIQVDKEERGTKGAALTTFITLAGSYLVLMPNNPDSGGISRRIEGEDRDQLREIIEQLPVPEGMGVIIRTAGVSRSKEELEWDLKVLLRYWEAVKQAAVAKPGPYLIHQESDGVIRAIRDHLRQDISEVIIDNPDAFHRAKEYIRQIRPDFVDHIKLYSDTMPLFSRFQIEKQIEAAYQREVRLPSGGSIVIDHSEALVAIDINSARATKGGNIEETALQTNLEAADEIAKQLRIRDIGGLVVIDFIDMTPTRNQREVENRLRNALQIDRARIQIGRISRFGLLEMSRQRLRASLSISSEIKCPRCEGRGTIRSVESAAISVLHLIQENASRSNGSAIQVQLPIDVSTFLINEKRDALAEIESKASVEIVIIPNRHLKSPHYNIKTTKDDQSKSTPSYRLVKVPKSDATSQKIVSTAHIVEPAVSQYLTDEKPQAPKKSGSNGLIKRLWDVMFGGEEEKKPVKPVNTKKVEAPVADQRNKRVREDRPNDRRDNRGDNTNRNKPQQRNNNRPQRERDLNRDNRDNRDQRGNKDNKDNKDNRDRNPNRDRNRDPRRGNNNDRRDRRDPAEQHHAESHPHPDSRNQHAHAPTVEKPIEAKPFVAPVIEPAIETHVSHVTPMVEHKPVEHKTVEQPVVVKPEVVEHKIAESKPVVTEKEFVPPPVPAAPENYKGLSAGKPLQQVVTKKDSF